MAFGLQRTRSAGVRLTGIIGVLLFLLLAGCNRDPGGQMPGVSGEAIEAQRDQIEGFGLARAFPDQREGTLAIALEFSEPLVGTQDFDALLTLADNAGAEGGWTLDDGGKVLRFPHVEANRDYTVRISAQLTSTTGDTLGKDVERKVFTGELTPVVGFASQGSVLPAKDSRGLPVVSINVDEVDVEFLRVDDASLPAFLSQYQRGGRRGSWELDSEYSENTPLSKLAKPVYVNRFVLGGARNERVLTYLPLQGIRELQQPGLYFAVMKRAGAFSDQFETAFFTVSDIGLHARAYRDKLFVHTAALQSGDPLGGIELKVLDEKGEAVFRGTTDDRGNALLDYTLDAAHVLVANRGSDVSLLPFNQPALDLSEFAVSGREQAWFDVFAWSGRDLYRPGEIVRISALLRDQDGRPVEAKAGRAQTLFARLRQPDGKTFFESPVQPGEGGYFRFEKEIPVDAPTGTWRVEFRTDPASREAVQGMTLRIEEFLPERMKLELDAATETLAVGQPLRLQATGAYLYGAPAAGNRFTARLAVAVERAPVDGMPGYFFGDPTVDLPREAKDVIDGIFDAAGELAIDIPLPDEVKPTTPIAAIVSGSLYETGGRSVNRSLKRVLWPADALVGVRPLFDDKDGADANSNARFELMRVGRDGHALPLRGLKVSLVREHRDYHWLNDDNGWRYEFTRRYETVETRVLDAGSDATRFDFPVEWGEYRVDVEDPQTKLVSRYPFNAGWSWNDENRGLDARPDKVKVSLDKAAYRAGDTMRVTVTPPHPGKGLLLVESDHLLYVHEIDARPGSTFDIPVTEDWERHDVYVTALVFRGGSATSTVTPARAVGVAHVRMDRTDRRIAVGLKAPELVRPEGPLQVTVSAPQLAGKDAWVTVSAVDVGILNITRFPVPDAIAHFFGQRRFGIDAYDLYGRVIESFEGGSATLRFGGDAPLLAMPQARRPTARVQTVDLFAGPVKLDARGNARVPLQLPDFNGTLRVSALVFSADSYGKRDVETVVRAPIVAEASMPRVLAPGDSSTVTLDLTNFSGRAGEFSVRVDGIGPLTVGEGQRTTTLAIDGKSTLTFPLSAREGYTVAKVRVRVDGNGHRVDRSYDLPVRPAWPSVLRSQTRVLESAAPLTLDASLSDGLMAGSVNARFSVSALPPIPFAAAIRGALDYPYGCAEQTTSKGYVALQLDEATASMLGVEGVNAAQRRQIVEAAFGRLASMQMGNGHFSMWGSDGYVNPILTPYIVEFLLDARDAGFAVPDTLLQKSLERLGEDLLSGSNGFYGQDNRTHLDFAYQAYAGYVLARVNRAPLGTLRALYDNERDSSRTGLPLVHLGLALTLQGDTSRGEKAIEQGFAFQGDRPGYLADYGTPLRDQSLMIALTHERDLARPAYDARAVAIGRDIEVRRNRSGSLYLSTQEQIALARLGRGLLASTGNRVSGVLSERGIDEAVPAAKVVSRRYDAAGLRGGVRFVPQITAVAGVTPPLYANIDVAGVPRTAPVADDSVIKVERRLYGTDGTPWTPGPLKEGEALIVAVSIVADRDMPDALLTDLLPAGLEVENFNLGDAKQWADVVVDGIDITERGSAAEVRHEEYRDDRFVAALKLRRGRSARVFYLVRAVSPGTYTAPPPLVEDMYRPELRGVGRSTPSSITVVQP